MSGTEIAMAVAIVIVAVLIVVLLVAGRSRRSAAEKYRDQLAGGEAKPTDRRARNAEGIVDKMQEVHTRVSRLVAEGRVDEARQLARALSGITRRDPEEWLRKVTEDLRANPDAPAHDFSQVRELAQRGRTIDAIREYRRLTGANLQEAKRVVAAYVIAGG